MKAHKNNEKSEDCIEGINIDEASIQEQVIQKSKQYGNKKWLTIFVSILSLTVVGLGVWYFIFYKNAPSSSNSSQSIVESIVNSDPNLEKVIHPNTGEVWLKAPVKIDKQGYLVSSEIEGAEKDTEYYQVGNRAKNEIIMSITTSMYPVYRLFEKLPDGTSNYIIHPDSLAVYNKTQDSFEPTYISSSVKIVDNVHYDSLSMPDQIVLDDKGSVVRMPGYQGIGAANTIPQTNDSDNVKQTVIKQFGQTQLIKVESKSLATELTSVIYVIKTPLDTQIRMRYEPLDLSLDNYQWQSGNSWTTGLLKPITRGCSQLYASVTTSSDITEDDVSIVGKSGDGQLIYEFKDSNNKLLQKAYSEFKDFYQNNTGSGYDYSNTTLKSFIYDHAVVLFKDVYNQWLVYVRNDYSPGYGCAKPVVYLYPTIEQVISVRVGADVKISDPLYDPKKGWTALAKPNGQLVVDGNQYNSLYWEGPGYGIYPEITQGIVVAKKDAISTIRQQLAAQNLNATEINHFVDYWQDKLPNKPYIRLTWFNTAQMNQLAPLVINPKPDTLIRIFLDASGLDAPISISPQTFQSIPRTGFTVVEWGGLSVTKLY